MTIHPCAQRSPEWKALRLGKLTGSRAGDAFATTKSGYSTSRANLKMQLVLERLTGESAENGFVTPDMERGTELEPEARLAYEARTGILAEQVGFVSHAELAAGCSPDGLVDDGLIEIKCPKATTHLDYLQGGLPKGYLAQIHFALWLTGKAWGDFVSYHPSFPDALRLKITRVWRKDLDVAAFELSVRNFLAEVDQEEAALRAMVTA